MEELVEKARNGDKQAFIEIIISINDYLYKIARTRLYCEDDIEDAIQDTILSAFCSIKKLKNVEFFKTWIIKILINNCNKIYKNRLKNNIHYDEYLIESYSSKQNEFETNIDFYILLKTLNYNERIVIVLYYGLGYKIKEISKILKINESTIKSRLSRGKEKIKERGIKYDE